MKKILSIIFIVLTTIGLFGFYQHPYFFGEKSPFESIKWDNALPFVTIDGQTYKWISAEGISMTKIKEFAKKNYHERWKHRIATDYLLVMKDIGHWVFFSTNVTLEDETGKKIKIKLTVNNKNRAKVLSAMRSLRIIREHNHGIHESLRYVTQRMDGYIPNLDNIKNIQRLSFDEIIQLPMDTWIGKEEAIIDLENLEYAISMNYSYADLKGVNYSQVIDVIIADLSEGITKRDLGIQIKRLLAMFGDGHSRVSRSALEMDSLFLSFNIKQINGIYYAFKNSNFLDQSHPKLVAIDGFSIDSIKNKAGELVAKGSPQFYENSSLQYISYYGFLQNQLGLGNKTKIQVKLSNKQDTILKEIDLFTKEQLKISEDKKMEESNYFEFKILEDNIGYMYLGGMAGGESFVTHLHEKMNEFQNTDGLIIDIRDNGGGSRKAIYALLPYYITKPKVINVNALRIDDIDNPNVEEPIGDLEERMSYPKASKHWSESERQVIVDFEKTFHAEWQFDNTKFSDWHYAVVSPNENYYSKQVVVLMNEGCFSASDIFLAAFKGSPNITLVGTPSGGGSGFMRMHFLPKSGLMYFLSRMASFQPDGKLYDGNGVQPDIIIENTLDDMILSKDEVLQRAIELIKK